MTVSANATIRNRSWRGYDDPGLPVGMYFGQTAVTGDATGGNMNVFFEFKGEGDPVNGRFYNLEQLNIFHSDTTAKTGFVVANNWETIGDVALVNRQWRYELEGNKNGVTAITNQTHFPLPLFLGSAAPVPALACSLQVGVDNIDVTSLIVTIQGYIWETRSIFAEGGLRRPVDSLYGRGN